jgi:hypothetical protein
LNMWVDGENVWIPSDIWKTTSILPRSYLPRKLMSIPSNVRVLCGFGFIHHYRHHRICVDFGTGWWRDSTSNRFFLSWRYDRQTIKRRWGPISLLAGCGFLFATPGNVVDYDIEDYIYKKLPRFWD